MKIALMAALYLVGSGIGFLGGYHTGYYNGWLYTQSIWETEYLTARAADFKAAEVLK
jgi:hypothetical protein